MLKFLSERAQEEEGRYEVPLLWKDENIQLPDNRVVAIHRFGLLDGGVFTLLPRELCSLWNFLF